MLRQVNPKILHAISFLMALSGGILAMSDSLKQIVVLNPTLAHANATVLAACMAFNALCRYFGWDKPAEPTLPINSILEKV